MADDGHCSRHSSGAFLPHWPYQKCKMPYAPEGLRFIDGRRRSPGARKPLPGSTATGDGMEPVVVAVVVDTTTTASVRGSKSTGQPFRDTHFMQHISLCVTGYVSHCGYGEIEVDVVEPNRYDKRVYSPLLSTLVRNKIEKLIEW